MDINKADHVWIKSFGSDAMVRWSVESIDNNMAILYSIYSSNAYKESPIEDLQVLKENERLWSELLTLARLSNMNLTVHKDNTVRISQYHFNTVIDDELYSVDDKDVKHCFSLPITCPNSIDSRKYINYKGKVINT